MILAAAEEIGPALHDHWEDATAAMHADDARRLYVDVEAPLAGRAVLTVCGPGDVESEVDCHAAPTSHARPVPRLARRVAGAQRRGGRGRAGETGPLRLPHRRRLRQPRRGRALALRARPARREAARGRQPLARAGPRLRRGAPARGLRQPRAAPRRLSPSAASSTAAAAPTSASAPAAAADSPSANCGSATTSSTRTTASPASPASRPGKSAASPATTSTSNTRARTASTSPPTSWRS